MIDETSAKKGGNGIVWKTRTAVQSVAFHWTNYLGSAMIVEK